MGAKHLFNLFKFGREALQEDDKKGYGVFVDSFFNNNFQTHIEFMILSLLADEDMEKRKIGVALIKEARETDKSGYPDGIRYFEKPTKEQVNLEAEEYSSFLLYDEVEKTEPPATFHLTVDQLNAIANGNTKLELDDVKCHR